MLLTDLEPDSPIPYDDFQRHYGRCLVRMDGEPVVVEGISRQEGGDILSFYQLDRDGQWTGASKALANVDVFDPTYPAMGYVNTPKGAIYVERVGDRQWHKAYHHDNVRVHCAVHPHSRGFRIRPTDSILAPSLYNRQYHDFSSALKLAVDNNKSVAVNSRVALLPEKGGGVLVEYKKQLVGFLSKQFEHVILFEPAEYVQEFIEYPCVITER